MKKSFLSSMFFLLILNSCFISKNADAMDEGDAYTGLMYAGGVVALYCGLRVVENTGRWLLWGKNQARESWKKEHVLAERVSQLEQQGRNASTDRGGLLKEDILVGGQLKTINAHLERLSNHVGLPFAQEGNQEGDESDEDEEEIILLHCAVDMLKETIGKPEDQVTKERPLETATLFARLNYLNAQCTREKKEFQDSEEQYDKELKGHQQSFEKLEQQVGLIYTLLGLRKKESEDSKSIADQLNVLFKAQKSFKSELGDIRGELVGVLQMQENKKEYKIVDAENSSVADQFKELKGYIPLLKHLHKKRERKHKRRESKRSVVTVNYGSSSKGGDFDSSEEIASMLAMEEKPTKDETPYYYEQENDDPESSLDVEVGRSSNEFELVLEQQDKDGNETVILTLSQDDTASPVMPKKQKPDKKPESALIGRDKITSAQENIKTT